MLSDDQLLQILFHLAPFKENTSSLIKALVTGQTFSVIKEIPVVMKNKKGKIVLNDMLSQEAGSWWDYRLGEKWANALIAKPLEWEKCIEKDSGLNSGTVLVTVPSDEVYPDKQLDARILSKENGRYKSVLLMNESPIIKDVGEALSIHRQLIRVLAPSDLPDEDKQKIKEASESLFFHQ